MNRLTISLFVSGLLCVVSAVSGISSFTTGNNGTSITHATLTGRIVIFAIGCAAFLCAWGIRNRKRLAWRAVFVGLGIQWVLFIVGGTLATAAGYATKPSLSETLLFGGMLALVSLPVVLYWGRRIKRDYAASFGDDG